MGGDKSSGLGRWKKESERRANGVPKENATDSKIK
jgi:hypothetical protein